MITAAAGGVATVALLPQAGARTLVMPGFFVFDQTMLLTIYLLGAWILFAQFRRTRLAALLLAAGGTLFSAAVVALQMLSVPGVLATDRLLGSSPATTTWLWTGWHLGPPLWGLAVAAAHAWREGLLIPPGWRRAAMAGAAAAAIAFAAAWGALATLLLPWLPPQTTGDDYSAVLSSGVGPAVVAVTIVATIAMLAATRRHRSVLDIWIITALVLMTLDNVLTLAGGVRGSLGWTGGRVLALASAAAVICAYLSEFDNLHAEAKAALSDLATTEAKLRAAQKMEAVGQLTGGIAHDFNNLLMIVTSGFDMIHRRPDDRERVLKMAEAGLQASERGARLTRQLLSFARRQPLHAEVANPNAQLVEFEQLAARAAGEFLKVKFALDASASAIRIDIAEFQAAVLNLVVNARDALTPRGGCVTVSTRNATVHAASPDGVRPPGEYVVVAVADDGPGMTAEIASRAFEPFFTTKDFGKGSGLGLSQVYGFARAAGGEAVIVTAPGQGTTVELWLPHAQPGELPSPTTREQDSLLRHARAGEVVLAVEDEPDVLAAVVENLADLGYQVLSARDAAEALERLRGPDRVDLLFSDVVMPGGMNGVQLATEATRLRPRLRVLLTSGYANQALEAEHDLPAHLDILPKPYRRAELATRLQSVMRAA